MGRAPCCDKENVKRGPWSPEEDAKLKSYIQDHGTGGNWIALPQKIGLKRCGKSCRLRWLNYLRPNIKHGGFSPEEDNIICTLYMSIGSRWSIIAAQLPGRTDNDIKNYWNTRLKKKLLGKQRKEVQHTRRSSSSCYVKVKQQHETKKTDQDPNYSYPQANINSNLQRTEPVNLSDYCSPRQHPPDNTTMSSFQMNQYPINSYTTTNGHDPPYHLIKKNINEEASNSFDLPFNMSSSNLDHNYQLPPYDSIYPGLDFQVSSTFSNNPTTINSTSTCDHQLSNTAYAFSSDLLLLSYFNNFPSINNYQMDESILYGFDEMSSLCGVDMVNAAAAGSFTGTSNSAESTSSWNIP